MTDVLDWLSEHTNYELSFDYDPYEPIEDREWLVHSVNGGVNDREWTIIGKGATPREALENARKNRP